MSFAASSFFDGTVQEIKFQETNRSRCPRPVTVKCRKLGGKRGRLVRTVGEIAKLVAIFDKTISDDQYTDVLSNVDLAISHWAVQVGPYLWELHTDSKQAKTLTLQRLTDDQIWVANVAEQNLGVTNMTDREIDYAGESHFIIGGGARLLT